MSLEMLAPMGSDLYHLGCHLRCTVFMGEQGVSEAEEFDGKDGDATHMVSLLHGNVVGVLRTLWLPQHAKIGRFAVQRELRGQGIGRQLFQSCPNQIKSRSVDRIMLEAQVDRIHFYQHFGFQAYGYRHQHPFRGNNPVSPGQLQQCC